MKTNLVTAVSVLFVVVLLVATQGFAVDGQAQPTPYGTYNRGDPYSTVYSPKEVSAPPEAKLPTITILSPINNTLIAQNSTCLTFNLTLEATKDSYPITLGAVCYKGSWQPNYTAIDVNYPNPIVNKTFQLSINAQDIPDGNQSITIYATAMCQYETSRQLLYESDAFRIIVSAIMHVYSNYYFISDSSTVEFTVDTTPPTPTPSATPDGGSTQFFGSNSFLFYAAAAAVVVVAALAGLFYLKKQRKIKS